MLVNPFAPLDGFLSRIGSAGSVSLGLGLGLIFGMLLPAANAILVTIGGLGFILAGVFFIRGFIMMMIASLRAGEGPFSDFDAGKVLARFWACQPALLGWGMVAGLMFGAGLGAAIAGAMRV